MCAVASDGDMRQQLRRASGIAGRDGACKLHGDGVTGCHDSTITSGVVDDASRAPVTASKDGQNWRIGTDADIAWIREGTTVGLTITSAIPPIFEAYATIVVPGDRDDRNRHDRALLAILSEQPPAQPWWLGYLDTGADDVVFHDVAESDPLHGLAVRVRRSRPAASRQLEGPVVMARAIARRDLSGRPIVAALDAVGRRMAVSRWTRRSHRTGPP